MALGDRFYRKAQEKIEARVGEPVEVVGWASRTGAMGAVIGGHIAAGIDAVAASPIGLGAAIPRGRMKAANGEKGARLPINFLVALTPNGLHVFKLRKTWTGLRLRKELGMIPREGIQLAIQDANITKQFRLEGADGTGIAFEMTRSKFATKFAEDLDTALGAR